MFTLIRDTAARFADRPFLVIPAEHRSYSYGDIWDVSLRLSAQLRREGVASGDRVLVLLDNGPLYVMAAFAAMLIGATLVPLSPRTPAPHLHRLREETGARLVIDSSFRLQATASAGWNRGHEMAATDALVVLYTTGTTGKQKGVVLTAGPVLANFTEYGARMGFGTHTRFLQPMPPYHADGWNFTLLLPFLHGAAVVLPHPSVPAMCRQFGELVQGAGANVLVGVPSILSALVSFAHRYLDPNGLAYAISSSETLYAQLKHDFEVTFSAPVYDLYGLTETQIVSYYCADIPWKEGSVGKLQRGVEIRGGPGGEIQVRSPYLFAGYFGERHATAEETRGEWFRTRDLGRIDEDGYLFLEGRMDAVITRGGNKVLPSHVDAVLREHPTVAEAATVGVRDRQGIEAIYSFVTASPDEATATALRRHCEAHLEPWARPTRVVFVKELPRSPGGKVDMAALRELAAEVVR